MPTLHFRLPGPDRPLGEWLALLFPKTDRAARRDLFSRGCVRVDAHQIDRADWLTRAGARVELDVAEAGAEAEALLRAIEEKTTPASGTGFAWTDAPGFERGTLRVQEIEGAEATHENAPRAEVDFEVKARLRGLALVSYASRDAEGLTPQDLCSAFGAAGMPVVGDLLHGGLACVAGLQIAPSAEALVTRASWEAGPPPWPESERPDAPLRLGVSDEVARAMHRGHPWILPDPASDSADRFRPGTLVRVDDRRGAELAWAWTEGIGPVAARLAAPSAGARESIASIESRIARALARRHALTYANSKGEPDRTTDCYRLVHGEADELPGLFIDRVGSLLRVLVTSRATDDFRERAVASLLEQFPVTPDGHAWSVLELLHLRASGGEFERVRWRSGGPETIAVSGFETFDDGFWVHERGLRFAVDPGWATPRQTRPGFGLFPDQRENRARLTREAQRGGRWLNLFAHTGAFSVSLLADGAEHVTSVDLSGPYLARLDANLEANRASGVDPGRHQSIRSEGRRFVERLAKSDRFEGIVLDPPTAAAAGRRFWSVRRDLEPLLSACLGRLSEQGVLLVTQNLSGPPLGLDQALERAAAAAGRKIAGLESATAGEDFPTLEGFPEGDPFEGWIVHLAAQSD